MNVFDILNRKPGVILRISRRIILLYKRRQFFLKLCW
jgi:hypothetical protein